MLILLSCEDTKKGPSENGTPISNEILVDTIKEDTNKEVIQEEKKTDKTEEGKKYPKITKKNAVSFLTEYGNENPETQVKITTHLGDIYIELYRDTPLHRANFIYLIKQNYTVRVSTDFLSKISPFFVTYISWR